MQARLITPDSVPPHAMLPPQRHVSMREVKFVVDTSTAAQIRAWVRRHMEPDPHGAGQWGDEYETTSVYFDTYARDVFFRRGSYGRSKYRIRRYGEAPKVFLERKVRTSDCLAKRRTLVDLVALPRFDRLVASPEGPGNWFYSRLLVRGLSPILQVSYRRTARIAHTAEGLARLTMDEDLRAANVSGVTFTQRGGVPLLTGETILEMKYGRQVPAVFKHLLEEFGLNPRSASKYRRAAESLGLAATGDTLWDTRGHA